MDPKEMTELGKSNLDRVLEALDRGDIEAARTHALTMEHEAKHAHDIMTEFVGVLLTYIGKHYGDDEVVNAMRSRHSGQPQVAERMLGMSAEDAVRFKTMIHRAHHSTMTVTEEQDRYVLKLDPCNTGGRILRERLDQPPVGIGRFGDARPETWSESDVPYYCGHCAMHSIMGVEKGAPHPTWIYERPKRPDDPCYQYCYKTTQDVPEKNFAELGLKKPGV